MLTIQNYNLSPARVSFKSGNENVQQEQKESPKVFKTHAGLKTGTGYAALSTISALFMGKLINQSAKFLKDNAKGIDLGSEFIEETIQSGKRFSKGNVIYIPVLIAASLGCGAIVDKAINKKNKLLAQRLETEDKKTVLQNEDRADLTRKENVFYKSNQGKKLGTLLGIVVLPALSFVNRFITKTKGASVVGAAIYGALGGFILGAITDKCANKSAAKFADKQSDAN